MLKTAETSSGESSSSEKRKKIARLFGFNGTREYPLVYPSDVRTALAHDGAKIYSKHIEQLVKSGNWQNLAFFLAMKATDNDDETQKVLLERLAARHFNFSQLDITDINPALDILNAAEDKFVIGDKLGAVARVGLDHWTSKIDETLTKALDAFPSSALFVVGNSPTVGLDVIAKHTLLQGKPLGMLKEPRLAQTQKPVGYLLTPGSNGNLDIEDLAHDFPRPNPAVIFDDVIKSGETMEEVIDFWMKGDNNPPYFVAGVRVNSVV